MRWLKDVPRRSVVARGPTGVEGYAAFEISSRGDWQGYDLACTHLVARTPDAARGLLRYFRRFKGVGRALKWQGPPNEPLGLILEEETFTIAKRFQFMSRLLDVPAALEGRGSLEGLGGEAAILVDDPLFEGNAGPFRIEADHGKVRVERTEARDPVRISIGGFSALFSGHVSPSDLVRTGAITGDHDALPFLAALFSGPPPWMLDHF
jgi:predicted acetyltransferase